MRTGSKILLLLIALDLEVVVSYLYARCFLSAICPLLVTFRGEEQIRKVEALPVNPDVTENGK